MTDTPKDILVKLSPEIERYVHEKIVEVIDSLEPALTDVLLTGHGDVTFGGDVHHLCTRMSCARKDEARD